MLQWSSIPQSTTTCLSSRDNGRGSNPHTTGDGGVHVQSVGPTLSGVRSFSVLGALGAASALLIGGLSLPAEAADHASKSSDVVYFRSVLCFAPAYSPTTTPDPGPLRASSCSPANRLNASNLGVHPDDSDAGYSSQNVAPDPALAGVPSTRAVKESASAIVLLPGPLADRPGVARYLLGPAEMTSTSIAKASVSRYETGGWVVNYTMTKRGTALWDKVAEENFHKLLAIDFDGKVVSAPLVQPTQSSFSSFDGQGEISGNFTKTEAMALAKALHQG